METIQRLIETLNSLVWDSGIPVGDEKIPFVVIALIGTGVFLTLRLGFLQLRRLPHGFAVTSGRYDDPNEPGDVSHFQALTTALSATVGIGNIAGVAIAIHWGGPGAVFWMWVTAFVGMVTKYTEVTLAQHYRSTEANDGDRMRGTVSGGPMYYIERGLGPRWKPLAVLFALLLAVTAFFTGNAIQANTVADVMRAEFGIAPWITGVVTTAIVGLVILGGITRIGKVTGVLAPAMAAIYVFGGLYVILANYDRIFPTLGLIMREAFNPTAGVAGTGVGVFLVTMMWGVRRGLFSNEAGQGSAPIAHAAAKTDEPVSEGVVALLEPFIDTLVICSITAMVVLMSGAWNDRVPTRMALAAGEVSYVDQQENGRITAVDAPREIRVVDGYPQQASGEGRLAWHDVAVERLFVDADQTRPFAGVIRPRTDAATTDDGRRLTHLYADAVRNGAPLTMLGFQRGLPGEGGRFIVIVSVLLFAVSTAISWSYYGDRCANYLFGPKAILPYKLAYLAMHFIGAVLTLADIWDLGDVFLGMVILPNLLALILLAPKVAELTRSYFQRRPWRENYEVHRRLVEERRRKHGTR
ncbi:MAG: alanine/glycine:cation symporter family protein [Thermoanaerobaculia bacterium]